MRSGLWSARFMPGMGMHHHKALEAQDQKDTKPKLTQSQYQALIDIKKERRKWDSDHKPLFKSIGFCLSLLAVTLAFNWKTVEDQTIMDLGNLEADANEILDIPVSEQPPPPPPKAPEVFTIAEVTDEEIIKDVEINLDIETTEETKIEEVVFVPEALEEETVETIFTIVEENPEPVGGMIAFYEYVQSTLKYPRTALRLNVTGKVYIQFVVEKDGSLTDVKVVKGIGAGCDEEAVRVVSGAPKWKPGRQRGVPVRVHKVMPIRFVITN